ncbi:hypothetical protein [Amycolatopsis sp. PS_44_ISF1]|uniref:hypothetical protein n=1 Tax=Amycolatopsis sp. PS_44_ISF1 TaxID=2974917 RepID=UPI0028DEE6C7|nr:hypothetical protein [Amycolatopsis sp. PS_44_ISF1]MDT8911312.1 hypothetical protein [Amycolatopsis sp. PS_44_ISF1]
MGRGKASRRVSADHLSPDLLAAIDSLLPGEEILVTREGQTVAKVTFARELPQAEAASDNVGTDYEKVSVVATAAKLSESARTSLSEQLGPGYIVVDMYSAPKSSVDVLLIPPLSPQLIGSLRQAFPQARVVIAEIEDKELGISYEGPVRRLLDAGADTYLPPSDIPRLARQLDHTMTYFNQLEGTSAAPLTIEPSIDNEP